MRVYLVKTLDFTVQFSSLLLELRILYYQDFSYH